jgi:SAM-dependent methyltransferase
MSRRAAIRGHYEPRISPRRPGHDIVDWAGIGSQEVRFRVLVENVPLANKRLLDIGCGVGDLYGYLSSRVPSVRYTGVDLLEGMVRYARARYPRARFEIGDVFGDGSPGHERAMAGETFDVVFASGTFNLNVGNNREFLPRAIARMFELSRELVVFNLLHERARSRHSHCVYFRPEDVLPLVTPPAASVRVLDDYLFNDFTIIAETTNRKGQKEHEEHEDR